MVTTVERLREQHYHTSLVEALRIQAQLAFRQRCVDAEEALDEALGLARQLSYPYAEAKALATYGDLLTAYEQGDQARDRYTAALAILRSLGEVTYAKRIEGTLAGLSLQ